MPPRPVLAGLLVLAVLPPFVAQAAGSVVGSFAMFSRLDRYHLELRVENGTRAEAVRLDHLTPHLSRDARRLLVPADGYAPSAGQAELVQAGLPDLATLLCSVRRDARFVRVRMWRGPLEGEARVVAEVTRACGSEPLVPRQP